MKRSESFLSLLTLFFAVLLVSACAAPAAAPTASVPTAVAIAATPTSPPPTDTAVPATDTPVPPTDTSVPPTDTPTSAPTETPTQAPSPTSSPTATRVPPTVVPKPKPTSTALAPLAWSFHTGKLGSLTDAMQKILGRKGSGFGAWNYYEGSLEFRFPSNESVNGVVTKPVGNTITWNIVGQPFTFPGNGNCLKTLLQPGDYAWSATIPGTGQAQGSFTIQEGQEVWIFFGK